MDMTPSRYEYDVSEPARHITDANILQFISIIPPESVNKVK